LGSRLDELFPPGLLHFPATGWNAETCVIPRAGHMLMMEPQWRIAAKKVGHWLASKLAT